MSSGNLVIRPLTAKLTRDTETFGKMDPYCKVSMGQQFKRTAVCQDGGKTPGWKDELSFRHTNEDIITVEVWDKDVASNDDLVGTGTIAFSTITQKGNKLNEWVNLSYKGKNAGQVLLDIQYYKDGGKDKMQAGGNPFAQPTQQTGFVQTGFVQQPTTFPMYQQQTGFVQTGFVQQQPTPYVQTTQTTYIPQQQTTFVQPQQFPQQTGFVQQGGFVQQQQYPQQQQQQFVQQSYPQQQQFPQQSYPQQQQFPQQSYPQQQQFPQQQYPQQGYPGQFQKY